MMQRILNSRGWKKFRRNKAAMAMLFVIAAYVVISLWIVLTSAINWMTHGALEDRPVLGALLVSGTKARVGPDEFPGFGVSVSREKQYLNNVFYLGLLQRAADEVAGLDPSFDRTFEDVLRDSGVSGRPLISVSMEALKLDAEHGAQLLQSIREPSLALPSCTKLVELCDMLPAQAKHVQEIAKSDDAKQLDNAVESVSNTMLNIGGHIEEYEKHIRDLYRVVDEDTASEDADALLAIDVEDVYDMDDALFDIEDYNESLYDAALIDRIRSAAAAQQTKVSDVIDVQIGRVNELVSRVIPMPSGFAGLVYRLKMICGTDGQGRSVLVRAIYSAKIAIQVGVVTGLSAVLFGSLLGAAAAFFGGWVDHSVNWLYSTFSSIPSLVLLAVLAFMFMGSDVDGTLVPLYVAFGMTYWIGPCRVIRGEAMKIKELEYVQAATAIGFGRFYILVRHIIPNTLHLMFINFSLLFIAAIKGEVILTFLGLGLKDGASWGLMINQSKSQIVQDFFWQIGTATFFMFVLVLAFNILTDALQDAFDPKHVS
ncbi:MAG: ABC transporter permease [Phycisphaeraceae bacterium]|nr:ABC transporter permease [Phycisphaerales bacterium]MCB9860760.1 ABC transporter permease [Phycisphaeraceae bacterium]